MPSWKVSAPKNDDEYFERMTKALFQAGPNWKMVEDKWPNFEKAFAGFSIPKVPKVRRQTNKESNGESRHRQKRKKNQINDLQRATIPRNRERVRFVQGLFQIVRQGTCEANEGSPIEVQASWGIQLEDFSLDGWSEARTHS